jgi:hypothetical protein
MLWKNKVLDDSFIVFGITIVMLKTAPTVFFRGINQIRFDRIKMDVTN